MEKIRINKKGIISFGALTSIILLFTIGLGLLASNDKLLGTVLGVKKTAPEITPAPAFIPSIPTAIFKPTETQTPTDTPTRQPKVSEINGSYKDWGKEVKLDAKTSASRFAPDDHMSTTDELFNAMNQYRQVHSLPSLNKNNTLCNMAQNRARELLKLGHLDGHEGASKYAHSQQEFDTIDEVLFGGIQPVIGVHIVEWGWDKSLTGHHEAINDPKWHDGCAGIAGYFAVFEFGAR